MSETIHQFPVPPARATPVTQVRSTLISSSVSVLRAHGHQAKYLELLAPNHHEAVLSAVPGFWIPILIAQAHYTACDNLGLNTSEIESIGADVGRRIQESVLKTLTQLATGVGVTPWTVGALFPRLIARIWQGGGFEIAKLGPKEATLTVLENPLLTIDYFRASFRGVVQVGLELFTRKCYVRDLARLSSRSRYVVRVSWV